MPIAHGATACANHPRREAIGICVKCRTQVCGECTTKVDGINYCVSCLAKLAGPRAKATTEVAQSSPWVSGLWLTLGAGVLSLMAWTMLEMGAAW